MYTTSFATLELYSDAHQTNDNDLNSDVGAQLRLNIRRVNLDARVGYKDLGIEDVDNHLSFGTGLAIQCGGNLIDTYLMGQRGESEGLDEDTAFQRYLALERKKSLGGRYYETAFLDTLQRPDEAAVRTAYVKQSEKLVIRHLLFNTEQATRAACCTGYLSIQAKNDGGRAPILR